MSRKRLLALAAALLCMALSAGCRQTASAPMGAEAFDETQTYCIELAKQFYLLGLELEEEVSEREKAQFFTWYLSCDDYRPQLEQYRQGDRYEIPLEEIKRIVSGHLPTDSLDPAKAFPTLDDPQAVAWYDTEGQRYITTQVGGYGGAAALGVLRYQVEGQRHDITLGVYDMNLYYQEKPEYQQIGRYAIALQIPEKREDYRILSAQME